jgi:phage shock protein A
MPKSQINRSRTTSLGEGLDVSSAYVTEPGSAEERLSRAVDGFSDRVSRAIHALERHSDTLAPELAADHPRQENELRRGLRDVVDQLQEAECERDALWEENERLKSEIVNLKQALTHTHHIHEYARAMEATRGWRMLVALRRVRRAIFRR